jgi:anthranilate synthase component II
MLLMIDNYDSFTYNLVQYLAELKQEVEVYRNDEITIDEIKKKNPQYIVLSPGPCTPNEAGVSLEVVNTFKGRDSHFRCLLRPSNHWSSIWGKNYSC